ncbi:putative nuclease HARBI1, partial [Temnothorax longispinosus]
MRFQNDETFFSYMRMSSIMFDSVLAKVGPKITKMETNWRRPIPAAARLAMTLRYLATGDGYQTIALCYRTGRSTTAQIIKETCNAIWDFFNADVLFTPTRNGWQKISDEFKEMWNFPNCIGALDGKHISIICPEKEGSTYYNYKGFHSVVLMALVSATYKFLIVDIGAQGRHS